jgi:cytochrome P450
VDGEKWEESRALLRPQFHKQRLTDLVTFERNISRMISLLPRDGRTIDISDYWHRFTMDASTEHLFGENIGSLENPKVVQEISDLYLVAFAKAFAEIQRIVFLRFRLARLWWAYNPSIYKPAIATLNQFVEPFVERAVQCHLEQKNSGNEWQNFTEALAEFTTDKKVLRDQLVNTLLAARDTTAAALSWLFYEFAYAPEKYAKLRNQVLSTLGKDRAPTYEELKNMKYMQWCINEGIPF